MEPPPPQEIAGLIKEPSLSFNNSLIRPYSSEKSGWGGGSTLKFQEKETFFLK